MFACGERSGECVDKHCESRREAALLPTGDQERTARETTTTQRPRRKHDALNVELGVPRSRLPNGRLVKHARPSFVKPKNGELDDARLNVHKLGKPEHVSSVARRRNGPSGSGSVQPSERERRRLAEMPKPAWRGVGHGDVMAT